MRGAMNNPMVRIARIPRDGKDLPKTVVRNTSFLQKLGVGLEGK
jgi:hypothetical protein